MSARKDAAREFLRMCATGDVAAAYARFVAPEFIHHNPYFAGDRASLQRAMEDANRESPNRGIDVLRVLEDGPLVAAHSRVLRADPAAAPIAVVHIMRFDASDRIVELWDVGQELPADSPNRNGAF